MASTGTRLRWASKRPLIRCRFPGPQLAAHTASSPVSAASAAAAKRGGLLVADVLPGEVAVAAQRVGQPVEGVAGQPVDAAHPGGLERGDHEVGPGPASGRPSESDALTRASSSAGSAVTTGPSSRC